MAGKPNIASKFFAGWKRVGEFIAHAIGMLLFALLWLVVFAPVALVMKMLGRRFLPCFTGREETYFLPKARIEASLESMRRQG